MGGSTHQISSPVLKEFLIMLGIDGAAMRQRWGDVDVQVAKISSDG